MTRWAHVGRSVFIALWSRRRCLCRIDLFLTLPCLILPYPTLPHPVRQVPDVAYQCGPRPARQKRRGRGDGFHVVSRRAMGEDPGGARPVRHRGSCACEGESSRGQEPIRQGRSTPRGSVVSCPAPLYFYFYFWFWFWFWFSSGFALLCFAWKCFAWKCFAFKCLLTVSLRYSCVLLFDVDEALAVKCMFLWQAVNPVAVLPPLGSTVGLLL